MTIYDWMTLIGIGGLFLILAGYLLWTILGMFREDPRTGIAMLIVTSLVILICVGMMGRKGML